MVVQRPDQARRWRSVNQVLFPCDPSLDEAAKSEGEGSQPKLTTAWRLVLRDLHMDLSNWLHAQWRIRSEKLTSRNY